MPTVFQLFATAARMRRFLAVLMAWTALSATAAEQEHGSLQTLGLLSDLESFIHQRGGELNELNARAMVNLMVDWYRFAARSGSNEDVLVYRYGGWSEGCATGFKLSLLRRVTGAARSEGDAARFAGITLMFEPSSRSELAAYSTTSGEWKSMEGFVAAIEGSPAFRGLESATPMAVMVESGGLR
jgi:hypothetical protein